MATRPTTNLYVGPCTLTIGAQEALQESEQTVEEFLDRHVRGDWGDISVEEAQQNYRNLELGYQVCSAYSTKLGRALWIITEPDPSIRGNGTTILLPEEYE